MLTYDQISEIRIAFDEAHVPVDRRRSQRLSVWCHAQIVPWSGSDRTGDPVDVVVVDFSATGIGILHNGRLKLGSRYLLEIPRPQQLPLKVIFAVVRCSQTDGGMFDVELSPDQILDVVDYAGANRYTGVERATGSARAAERRSTLRTAMICMAFVTAAVVTLVHLLEPPDPAGAAHIATPPDDSSAL